MDIFILLLHYIYTMVSHTQTNIAPFLLVQSVGPEEGRFSGSVTGTYVQRFTLHDNSLFRSILFI
jgi:hypothetical protein